MMPIIQKHEAVFERTTAEAEEDLVKPFINSLNYFFSCGS